MYKTDALQKVRAPKGKYAAIKYIVIDVDGTMTDAGIYYDENGNEIKKFSTKDAAGFFTAKVSGIKTVVLTGRECAATTRRMHELAVDFLEQNVRNKVSFLRDFMEKHNVTKNELAYIGDDLNDYCAMKLACFVGCPGDAEKEIVDIADYISKKRGGEGAVRDTIEYLLKKRGQWRDAISTCYEIGI